MDRSELLTFLRDQKWAVEASVSVHGAPQAAVVGVVVSPELEIVFDTFDDSRKAENLRRNRKTALVIGWDDGRTVQIEGHADEPRGDDLARLTKLYYARFADGEERAKASKVAYFRVRPTWIRISDFRGKEPSIVTLTAADLREPRRPSRAPKALPVEVAPPEDAVEPEAPVDEGGWDAAPEADIAEHEARGSEAPPSSSPRGSGQGTLFEE